MLNLFHCFISQDPNDGKGCIIGLKEHVSVVISQYKAFIHLILEMREINIWKVAHCS